MDWVKTTARRDKKHLSCKIGFDLDKRLYGTFHDGLGFIICLFIYVMVCVKVLKQWTNSLRPRLGVPHFTDMFKFIYYTKIIVP